MNSITFLNIFTTRTSKAKNHLSKMELLINEDMYDVNIPIWIMKESSPFQCFIRRYHVYINIWLPLVSKCLKSRNEPANKMDKAAVAVIRISSRSEEVVFRHVLKNMFKIVFMFFVAREMHQLWKWIRIRNSSYFLF